MLKSIALGLGIIILSVLGLLFIFALVIATIALVLPDHIEQVAGTDPDEDPAPEVKPETPDGHEGDF